MKNLSEYINDKNNCVQSAQTKFDLLIYGVQDNQKLFEKYQNIQTSYSS